MAPKISKTYQLINHYPVSSYKGLFCKKLHFTLSFFSVKTQGYSGGLEQSPEKYKTKLKSYSIYMIKKHMGCWDCVNFFSQYLGLCRF